MSRTGQCRVVFARLNWHAQCNWQLTESKRKPVGRRTQSGSGANPVDHPSIERVCPVATGSNNRPSERQQAVTGRVKSYRKTRQR